MDGDKYVKIEDEWSKWCDTSLQYPLKLIRSIELAGHHRDFREKLIMMDAEQPGAPGMLSQSICLGFELTRTVFAKGTSLDYTGYSPLTRDWTDDPRSIKDSEGQEVMFLPVRPPHLPHNPKCGYLMCEGLVMLDQDNIPIKEYPGAPRTLATSVEKAPGYLLQGLRSILGMTVEEWVHSRVVSSYMLISYFSLRARMLVEGDSKSGKRRSHGPTSLTNRTDRWRWDHNLPTWHPRKPRNATKTRASTPSKSSKERKSTSTSGPDLNVEPAQMADGPGSEDIKWDDFDD